jgi:hypothetical protein
VKWVLQQLCLLCTTDNAHYNGKSNKNLGVKARTDGGFWGGKVAYFAEKKLL